MDVETHDRRRTILITIMVASFLLTIPYFLIIQALGISGLTAYFMQLGLYVVLYLLAFWGLHRHETRLRVSWRLALEAVGLALVSWLLYVIILQGLGAVDLSGQLAAIVGTQLGTILLRVLMTWFFVGLGEELLFRGYLLTAIRDLFTLGSYRRRTTIAILLSSAFFSIWHLPIRVLWLLSGEIGIGLLLVSLLIVFVEGIAFAYLYVRTQNILMVGLVHGLVDLPLIGGNTQLSFIVLLAAIAIVEVALRVARKTDVDALQTAN